MHDFLSNTSIRVFLSQLKFRHHGLIFHGLFMAFLRLLMAVHGLLMESPWTTFSNSWTTFCFSWTTSGCSRTTNGRPWTTFGSTWTTKGNPWTTNGNPWTANGRPWTSITYRHPAVRLVDRPRASVDHGSAGAVEVVPELGVPKAQDLLLLLAVYCFYICCS